MRLNAPGTSAHRRDFGPELSKEKRSFAMLLIPRIAVIALKMARDQVRLAETENRAKKKLVSITTETSM